MSCIHFPIRSPALNSWKGSLKVKRPAARTLHVWANVRLYGRTSSLAVPFCDVLDVRTVSDTASEESCTLGNRIDSVPSTKPRAPLLKVYSQSHASALGLADVSGCDKAIALY